MIKRNDEGGYVLLLVLFLIVIIVTVSAVFLNASLSNAKQEKIVDKKHLSVVAAEMGVDYYKTLFVNAFLEKKDELDKQITDQIEGQLAKKKTPAYASFRDTARTDMLTHLNKRYEEINEDILVSKTLIFDFNFSDLGSTVKLGKENGEIIVEGTIRGFNEDDDKLFKDLTYTLSFFIPSYDPKDFKLEPDSSVSNSNIAYDEVFPSPGAEKCGSNIVALDGKKCTYDNSVNAEEVKFEKHTIINIKGSLVTEDLEMENKGFLQVSGNMENRDEIDLKKSHLKVSGSLSTQDLGMDVHSSVFVGGAFSAKDEVDLKNSLIYILGSASAGDLDLWNSKIHVGGPLTIEDELDLKNSKLNVGGSATVNDIDSENSSVVIGGTITVKDELDLDKKSTLFVSGDLIVKDEMKLKKKSRICVGGNVSAKEVELDKNTTLILVKGMEFNHKSKYSKNIVWVNSFSELQEKCGQPYSEGVMEEWDLKDINVNY